MNSVKEISFSDHSHSNYTLTTHTHNNYALSSHTHSNYALTSHTHSGYATSSHTHSNYMTKSQVQSMIDEAISSGGGGGSNTTTLKINGSDFSSSGGTGCKYTIALAEYCGFSPAIVKAQRSSFNITANSSRNTYNMIFMESSDISIPQTVYASQGDDYTKVGIDRTTYSPNYEGYDELILVLVWWSTSNNLTVLIRAAKCKIRDNAIRSVDLYDTSEYISSISGSMTFTISG